MTLIQKKINLYCFFCAIVLMTGFFSVKGQTYHFEKFTSKDGLIQSNVRGIVKDKNGFLWIATDGGLSQFDGKKFISYSTNNGLKQPSIQSICSDKNGNIWFGHTTGNIGYYDGKKFNYPFSDTLILRHRIQHLFCDSEGKIWASTIGAGVFLINPKNLKTIKQFSEKENLCEEVFRTMQGSDGKIWFVTQIGIKQFDKKANEIKFFKPAGLPFYNYTCMLEDFEGNLWFGSDANGLIKYNVKDNSSQQFEFDNGQISGFVVDLMLASDSSVWAASWAEGAQAGGLIRVKGNDLKILSKHNGLPGEKVISVFEDQEKNIWAGLFNSGLCKFKGFAMAHLSREEGLKNTVVNSIFKERDRIWCGTDFGIFIFKETGSQTRLFREINTMDDLGSNQITSIIGWKEKIIVATFKGKIGVYNKESLKLEYFIQIKKSWINTLAVDHDELLWIGSANGITTYNFGNKEFKEISTFEDYNVLKIFPDQKGKVWIGCREGGLFFFSKGKFNSLNRKEGIEHKSPTSIFEDRLGNIWIGTEGGGLFQHQGETFKKFGLKEGLPSDFINFITEDLYGHIWVGTNKGLGEINLQTKEIKIYQEPEGFIYQETLNNSNFRDEKGSLWIGTNNGVILLNPKEIIRNQQAPGVIITHFQIYSSNYSLKNQTLSYDQNDITFHFKSIALKNPQRLKFQYQLKGYDNKILISQQENVHYTNLPPGQYSFIISAINEDGVKSREDAVFEFEIRPPFWKTNWFIFLSLFTGLVSIYLIIFFRTLNLRRAKEKLEILVKERTNEIELKNFTLQKANLIISNKNKEITDSINYAKKIQEAILPSKNLLTELFPESFILFKPKDIVSGDFYWFSHLSNQNPLLAGLSGATENVRLMARPDSEKDHMVIAVADCTGHGVPGAFMCMIGTSLLDQIVHENEDAPPSTILTLLNQGIQNALKQSQTETQDGMDIALCSIDRKNKILSFSGAMRPLYYFRNLDGKITFEEFKPDKNPIGGIHGRADKKFTLHTTPYQKGDTIYLFSDGFADQFGGENGKKLMTKKFRELIVSIQHLKMAEQYYYLENFMDKWKNGYDQVDDVIIMGIRF